MTSTPDTATHTPDTRTVSIASTKPAETIKLRLWRCEIPCPHCGVAQEGCLDDPRGATETCENRGHDYHVPHDTPIVF